MAPPGERQHPAEIQEQRQRYSSKGDNQAGAGAQDEGRRQPPFAQFL